MSQRNHKPDRPTSPAPSSELAEALSLQGSCQEQREEYLFGMLAPEEESAYLDHARGCDACQVALAAHRQLNDAFLPLEEARRVPPQVTAQEHQQLLKHVEAHASKEPPATPEQGLWARLQRLLFGDVQPGRVAWLWPLAAATCLALLVLPERQPQTPQTKPRKRAPITARAQAPRERPRGLRQPARPSVRRTQTKHPTPHPRQVAATDMDLAAFVALPEDQPGATKPAPRQAAAPQRTTPQPTANAVARRRAVGRQPEKASADEPRNTTDRDFPEEPTIQARPDGTLEKGEPLPTLTALSTRSQGLQQLVARAPSAQQRAAQPQPFRAAVISLD